jgi:hypothetical protein
MSTSSINFAQSRTKRPRPELSKSNRSSTLSFSNAASVRSVPSTMNEASGNPRTTHVGLPPTVATMRAADGDESDNSGDICDGDESDDDEDDLQALLYLAQLPYCRLTKTFVCRLPSAANPAPVHAALNDPSAACISPFPAASAAAHDDADAVDDQRPPEIDPDDAAMSEDDNDYAYSSDDDGSDDDVDFETEPTSWEEEEDIAPPAPPRPALVTPAAAAAAVHASAAATATTADMAPTAATTATDVPAWKIRSREVVVGENRQFVEANFVPADGDGSRCRTCKVCGLQVLLHGRNKVNMLLRHATSQACLLRRVELGLELHRDEGPAAAAGYCRRRSKSLPWHAAALADAFRSARGSCFVPPTGQPGADATSLPWTCRHCKAPIVGHSANQPFLQHTAVCIGIVPLLQTLAAIIWDVEPASPAPDSVVGDAALVRRPRVVIGGENRAFIEATFVSTDDDRSGFSTCTTCGKQVVYGGKKVKMLLRHAGTKFCLLRRVELRRDAQRRGSAATAPTPSPIRRVNLTSRDPGVKDALRNVWKKHFLPPDGKDADSTTSSGLPWRCRHCTASIHDMNDQLRFVQHMALCVGIVPLLHHLTTILLDIEPAPPMEPGPPSVGAPGRSFRPEVVRENREFVDANFVPTEPTESSTCKICGKHVLHAHQRTSQLLRHALTSSCLLRRVANDAATEEEGSVPPGSSHPAWWKFARSKTLLVDAFRGVWGSHFSSHDGTLPVDAASSLGRWRCRHCSAVILVSRDNMMFSQHLVSCIGIVSLMRSLKATLQQLVLSASTSNGGEQRKSDRATSAHLGSGEQDNGMEVEHFSAPPDSDAESGPAEPPPAGGAREDQFPAEKDRDHRSPASGDQDDPWQERYDSKHHGVVARSWCALHGEGTGPESVKALPSCRILGTSLRKSTMVRRQRGLSRPDSPGCSSRISVPGPDRSSPHPPPDGLGPK